MSGCEKHWIDFVSAIGPIVISLGIVYVAWQQWCTAEKKRKIDLFDKRYSFFQKIWSLYEGQVIQYTGLDEIFILNYVHEAEFLFGKEIAEHILEIPNKLNKKAVDYDWFSKPFKKYMIVEN